MVSYFKVHERASDPTGRYTTMREHFEFFDDANMAATRKAYDAAIERSLETLFERHVSLSVYRQPPMWGPWAKIPVVGELPCAR